MLLARTPSLPAPDLLPTQSLPLSPTNPPKTLRPKMNLAGMSLVQHFRPKICASTSQLFSGTLFPFCLGCKDGNQPKWFLDRTAMAGLAWSSGPGCEDLFDLVPCLGRWHAGFPDPGRSPFGPKGFRGPSAKAKEEPAFRGSPHSGFSIGGAMGPSPIGKVYRSTMGKASSGSKRPESPSEL